MGIDSLRFLLPVLAITGTAFCSNARILEPEAALARLQSCSSASRAMKAPAQKPEHVYTCTDSLRGEPTLYVYTFHSGKGFVIAPASDRATPLLGYSDSSYFDPTEINPELDYWLKCYSEQVAALESDPSLRMVTGYQISRSDDMARAAIEPLITAKWNQDAPYNDACPEVLGHKSVAGCVPTAFAQVMRYHKWPQDYAKGECKYKWKVNGTVYADSLDFSKIKFDWANMPDALSPASPKNQIDAVAQLVHACGVMSYALYTPNETETSNFTALQGLIEFMDYDKGAYRENRVNYHIEDWQQIIYDELAAGRPVIYSGRTGTTPSDSGHSFICDGYNADNGYFHFNWGWGGIADGYYAITDLTPNGTGIGGTSSEKGYNYEQSVCVGIRPAVEGSEYRLMLSQGKSLSVTEDICPKGDWIYFNGDFSNYSLATIEFYYGLKLVDYDNPDNVVYVRNEPGESLKPEALPSNQYYSSLAVYSMMIPEGKYYASFVYKLSEDDEWMEPLAPIGVTNSIILESNETYVTFNGAHLPTELIPLKLINLDLTPKKSEFTKNEEIELNGTFWNPSPVTAEGIMGLMFTEIDNPDVIYCAPSTYSYSLKFKYAMSSWYGNAAEVPDGKYVVTPIFRPDGTNDWIAFDYADNIKHSLTCEVEGDIIKFYEIAGINDITADTDDITRYFDLQGNEIQNPASGIFIRVKGGKADKVYIK